LSSADIWRGTRLYDGKNYFTIYEFVKAHHHFNDPEWMGNAGARAKTDQGTWPPRDPKPKHLSATATEDKGRPLTAKPARYST